MINYDYERANRIFTAFIITGLICFWGGIITGTLISYFFLTSK